MFVAVVIEAFDASREGEMLDLVDFKNFVSVWCHLVPDVTWFIYSF